MQFREMGAICNWGSICKFCAYLLSHVFAVGMIALALGYGLNNYAIEI